MRLILPERVTEQSRLAKRYRSARLFSPSSLFLPFFVRLFRNRGNTGKLGREATGKYRGNVVRVARLKRE